MFRQLLVLCFVIVGVGAARAAPSSLQCGRYDSPTSPEVWIRIENRQQATLNLGGEHGASRYVQTGDRLRIVSAENGMTHTYRVGDDGTIEGDMGLHAMALAEPADCLPEPAPAPAGSCMADLDACVASSHTADMAALRGWCEDESVPFACARIISRYEEDAREARRIPTGSPTPCLDDIDGSTCTEAMRQAEVLRSAAQRVVDDSAPAPLPADRLDAVDAFCRQTRSAGVCEDAARALWDGGRYLQARASLRVACDAGNGSRPCDLAAALTQLRAGDATPAAAETLPCGVYVAAHGLVRELPFGDHGIVEGMLGQRMQARLQDGVVNVRHDRHGDFMFRPLDGDRLLGVDTWNRFAVYVRQPGDRSCLAPRAVLERPLPQDCPAGVDEAATATCCAAGSLQGCNAYGSHLMMRGEHALALQHYASVCEAGVRIGCENMIRAGDDPVAPVRMLGSFCKVDPHHVACSVIDTFDPARRMILDELRRLERE